MLKRSLFFVVAVSCALAFGFGLGRGLSSGEVNSKIRFQIPTLEHSLHAQSESPVALVNVFVGLSKKMVPSVVNIFTTISGKSPWGRSGEDEDLPGMPPGGGPNDIWRHFFEEFFGSDPYGGGPNRGGPMGRAQSLGSGFIIEATADGGLILTNNHVVEDATEVKVKFTESSEERETRAEVIGRDTDLDVALLKVKTKRQLVPVSIGDSDMLEQGEWIMAVGNPFGHGHSVTTGVISAKERTLPGSYSQYLQVDAPINPGNSGGPLANLNGQVVGINNAIQANAQGIGFAIPINLVKGVLPQLKTKGRVERGYIGINIEDLRSELAKSLKINPDIKAPIVTNVIQGAPAEKAGVQAYDVILEVNGKAVHTTTELVSIITNVTVGEKVKLKILRQGQEKTYSVEVAKRPTERAEKRGRRSKPKAPKRQFQKNAGMQIEQIDDEIRKELGLPSKFEGIIISQIRFGSPADEAGLTRGDIIIEVDRKPVRTVEEFERLIQDKKTHLLRIRKQDPQSGEAAYGVATLDLSGSGNRSQSEEEN